MASESRCPWMLAGAIVALAAALLVSGCAARGAVAVSPTESEQVAARRLGVQAAAYVEAIGAVAGEVGAQIERLPVPAAVKTGYDCALLQIAGTAAAAGPAVVAACGPVPVRPVAPLTVGMEALRAVTTCASLRATVSGLQAWISPLVARLEQSGQAALVMAGASLRVTLSLLVSGGASCLR